MLYRLLRPAGTAALLLSLTLTPLSAATPKALLSKHAAVSDTVTMLERAKKTLETDTNKDTAQHKAKALADIEQAMTELRQVTQGSKH